MIVERKRTTGQSTYQVRIWRADPVTGKRKLTTIGTYKTLSAAERSERRAKTKAEDGSHVDASRVTVAERLESWLRSKSGSVTSNTIADYRSAIDRLIVPAFGHRKVQKFTPAVIQDQYSSWLESGVSPRMVHRCHLVLSQALEQSVRFGELNRNPCAVVDKPALSKAKPKVWTASEVNAFVMAAKTDDWAPLWHLLALEGMRRGEALGLRWSDIDWTTGTANVVQTVIVDKRDGSAAIQSRTKTSSGSRAVRLTGTTLGVLKQHRDGQRFQRQAAGDLWRDLDLINANAIGDPINPNSLTRAFARLVKKADVTLIRVHDCRHSVATLLLKSGTHPKIVSERLGHSKVGVTLDLYSHVLPDMQSEAAATMDAIVRDASRRS